MRCCSSSVVRGSAPVPSADKAAARHSRRRVSGSAWPRPGSAASASGRRPPRPRQIPLRARRIQARLLASARYCSAASAYAGVVVGIAQAAQLRRRQARLGAHRRQLGARNLRLLAQRMAQQQLLEDALRLLASSQRNATSPAQAGSRAVLRISIPRLRPAPAARPPHCSWPAARWPPAPAPGIEDAVRIALGKAMQQRLGAASLPASGWPARPRKSA
jgi:hypothetical protein